MLSYLPVTITPLINYHHPLLSMSFLIGQIQGDMKNKTKPTSYKTSSLIQNWKYKLGLHPHGKLKFDGLILLGNKLGPQEEPSALHSLQYMGYGDSQGEKIGLGLTNLYNKRLFHNFLYLALRNFRSLWHLILKMKKL